MMMYLNLDFFEKKKRYNSKLIFCCHGGGFQTQVIRSKIIFLMRTCDKILFGEKIDIKIKSKNFFKYKKLIKTF